MMRPRGCSGTASNARWSPASIRVRTSSGQATRRSLRRSGDQNGTPCRTTRPVTPVPGGRTLPQSAPTNDSAALGDEAQTSVGIEQSDRGESDGQQGQDGLHDALAHTVDVGLIVDQPSHLHQRLGLGHVRPRDGVRRFFRLADFRFMNAISLYRTRRDPDLTQRVNWLYILGHRRKRRCPVSFAAQSSLTTSRWHVPRVSSPITCSRPPVCPGPACRIPTSRFPSGGRAAAGGVGADRGDRGLRLAAGRAAGPAGSRAGRPAGPGAADGSQGARGLHPIRLAPRRSLALRLEEAADLAISAWSSRPAGRFPRASFRSSRRDAVPKDAAALGEAWTPQAVCFSHSAPLYARSHHRFFGTRVEFGREINGIVCLTRDLERANPDADPAIARYIQQYVDSLAGRPRVTLSDEVRRDRLGDAVLGPLLAAAGGRAAGSGSPDDPSAPGPGGRDLLHDRRRRADRDGDASSSRTAIGLSTWSPSPWASPR